MTTVRLGIIGLGVQGSAYADLIAKNKIKNMEIGALCVHRSSKVKEAERRFPGIPVFDNYVAMMKSGEVDAVVICVPHYLHPEIAMQGLNHDLHVLLEKPAAIHAKHIKEVNKLATNKPSLTFAMMYNQRTNELYQKVKEVIDNDGIGPIRRANWMITTWWRPQAYYDQSSWRATWEGEGGGVLVNQAPHQLDLFQWLCGMPKKVFATIQYGYQRDITVDDDVTAIFDYGNGATGIFTTCTHDIIGTDRLEIMGDKGKMIVEDSKKLTIKRLHQSESTLSDTLAMQDLKELITQQGSAQMYEEEVLEFNSVWGEQHTALLENFAANILDGTPLLAPGKEGVHAVELTNAIYLSSWLAEEVTVPVDENLFEVELSKKIAEEKRQSFSD
ncbi:Gfo/Idh/MocA family protein [Aquibacillus sediminis]|uniref:Gfo/Idh/MocA family protein n=1 Tax=Aquibacillus sediminis TaxID=2574734 RepID=UPI0011091ABD|nr:Gfo/Idh/MocA family oxidoreductase [Aquibacillus sediminis]